MTGLCSHGLTFSALSLHSPFKTQQAVHEQERRFQQTAGFHCVRCYKKELNIFYRGARLVLGECEYILCKRSIFIRFVYGECEMLCVTTAFLQTYLRLVIGQNLSCLFLKVDVPDWILIVKGRVNKTILLKV